MSQTNAGRHLHAASYTAVWHVNAALLATFAGPPETPQPAPNATTTRPSPPDELAARAAEHGDAHVIKLTEACLREHHHNRDPAYLHAAHTLQQRMPPLHQLGSLTARRW